MAERPINVPGWKGVDFTTDEFLLGKKPEPKSALAYNYRAKNGIRRGRGGFPPVFTTDTSVTTNDSCFKKAGVYFPSDARAILPLITTNYNNTFYLASTTEISQYAFSVEFWYRADYTSYNRTVCEVPVSFTGGITNHLKIIFYPQTGASPYPKMTALQVFLALSDEGGPEAVIEEEYISLHNAGFPTIPTDGEWHHMGIVRVSGQANLKLYIDGEYKALIDDQGSDGEKRFPLTGTFETGQDVPNYYNNLILGGDDTSMCEFRIWKSDQSDYILTNMYTEIDPDDETDLVTYIPFNEGTGKYFTDQVGGARGYFHPQEPFVNDDDELVFTGYQCMAYPSLRGSWDVPDGETLADHIHDCEDGAYDGGILWDTVLGLESTYDYELEGIWKGTAQMRIRLRQLKEGVLCGRLGMCYDGTAEKYRLFFVDESNVTTYMSDAVIDENHVGEGNEFTITIFYYGDSDLDEEARCVIYIDDTEESADPSGIDAWANGNEIGASDDHIFHDTTGTDDSGGAIGGSPSDPNFCVAFDLIFFRQWWDDFPGRTEVSFIDETYNEEDLGDEYKFMIENMQGYVTRGTRAANFEDDAASIFVFNANYGKAYIRLPFHYRSASNSMDGMDTWMILDPDGTTFKQDIYIHRILDWDTGNADRVLVLPTAILWEFADTGDAAWGSKRHFNGALISNCVNYYNHETFKKNQLLRSVFSEDVDANRTYTKNEIHPTITDDSPLQSVEKAGTFLYKTRYLLLANDDRNEILTQRSHKPRWCDGRMIPLEPPVIRGIHRYTSEDGKVDKLLVAAWSSVWELDTSAGTIAPLDWAWLDRNDDLPINFLTTNNKLLATDTKSAIKINYRGNWSRLGIERPVDVRQFVSIPNGATYDQNGKFGWAAQFYDSENNVYGGTIPVYTDENQGVEVHSANGLQAIDIFVRPCKDNNVDRCLVWRTEDYNDTGTGTNLYKVHDTINPQNLADVVRYRDIWTDVSENTPLSTKYLGVEMLPPFCKGITVAFNRVFAFGADIEASAMYWSDVDSLGFPHPDQFPPAYRIIVEEGGTTEGRALVEFSNTLFAFKDNAIFEVRQNSPTSFSVQLVYKGVGAVNQRSVVVAGNSILFIDRSGIYQYRGGEPIMVSTELADYFSDEVDQDALETKAFLLHDKTEELVYCFVPSDGAPHCDRCIVFDLRDETFTIDQVPYATCGYIDEADIYIGTPYGQVLQYDADTYLDGVDTAYTGTALVL